VGGARVGGSTEKATAAGGALLELVRVGAGGEGAREVGDGDEGAGDVGAVGLEGLGRASRQMNDQHGPGTCAKTEASVITSRGREHAERIATNLRATRGSQEMCGGATTS